MEDLLEYNADLGNEVMQSTSPVSPIVRFIQEFGVDEDIDALSELISQHLKNLLNAAIQCARPQMLEYIINIIRQCDLNVKFAPHENLDDHYLWKWILENCAAGQLDGIVGLSLYEQNYHQVFTSDNPMDYECVREILTREFHLINNC